MASLKNVTDGERPGPVVAVQPPKYSGWIAGVAAALILVVSVVFGVHKARQQVRPPTGSTELRWFGPTPTTSSPAPAGASTNATGGDVGLPAGWVWHRDPAGFHVAVPAHWATTRDTSMTYFREPQGARLLVVGVWQPISDDPVAAWRHDESDAARHANYRQVRLETVPDYFQSCADWEYSYDGDGGRVHVVSRGFRVGPGRWYTIVWRTRTVDLQLDRPTFWLVVSSFRAF